MKRVVCLFLAILVLIPLIPIKGEGTTFIKDVDVLLADFQLYINDNRLINHKEIFLYDGDFYVPLTDLARALEIDINIVGNTVYLDTNNKLNIDSYDSKLPQVFQNEYELLSKERFIQELENEVEALEGKSIRFADNGINAYKKNIKVGFGNISIYLDDKKINLDKEVLKYNNDIYVALDSIATYLYITPEFIDGKNYININTSGLLSSNTSPIIDYILDWQKEKNYLLDWQKEELERRKNTIKNLNIPYQNIRTLNTLEKYLNLYFYKINDLELNIKLSKQANTIYINISFPSSKYNLWTKLTRLDVEDWIWNLYTAIITLYNDNITISGVIENPYYSQYSSSKYKNYVSFYSKNNDIYFDFTNSKLTVGEIVNPNYLLELLTNNLNKYSGFEFNYDVSKSGDNLELNVYPNTDLFNNQSLFSKVGYLKTLSLRIRNIYPDIDIYGKIIYPDNKLEPLDFYIRDSRIRSKDLLNETIAYLNNNLGYFYAAGYGYRLRYSLYETDLMNLYLVAEGDFSVKDDRWINGGDIALNMLNTTIQYAVTFVSSLWDANLIVDIVDNEGVGISEFTHYYESVYEITASPRAGKVAKGQIVYLYTATPDATIYYTVDGSTPNETSLMYGGSGIQVNSNMTIKAIGYKEGLNPSPVSTFTYEVEESD